MAGLIVSLAASILTGTLLVWALIGASGWSIAGVLLRLSLGTGLGLGLSGVVTFLVTVTIGPYADAIMIADIVVLVASAALFAVRLVRAETGDAPLNGGHAAKAEGSLRGERPLPAPRWMLALVVAGFVLLLAACVARFVFRAMSEPHGQSDAKSTWTLRARMLLEHDEKDWRRAFTTADLTGYLGYYPPLHSVMTLRYWKWAGSEPQLALFLNAALFALATVGVLVSSLLLAGRGLNAFLAAIALMGMPDLVFRATSLYADIPVGFLFLAAVSLLTLRPRLGAAHLGAPGLAGLATGLTLVMKQEGFLFTIVVSAGVLWRHVIRGEEGDRLRPASAFAAGLLPLVALFVYFKTCIAHNPDPAPSLGAILSNAVDLSRHGMIVKAFFTEILSLEHWGVIPVVLPFYLLVVGGKGGEKGSRTPDGVKGPGPFFSAFSSRRAGLAALRLMGCMMIGFYLFFLLLMWGLPGTLYSTFDRGMLQLWPTTLFGLFLLMRAPGEAVAPDLPAPAQEPVP